MEDVGSHGHLDEKLAEYVFFPLSHVFNESQRLSSRCLEVAVRCLKVLISQGWGHKLQPDMGKQLLILMTLLVGRSPTESNDQPRSEELTLACFQCMGVLFEKLGQGARHVFDETGAKTIVDQSIYLLLENILQDQSEDIQLDAARSLHSLLVQIKSRVVLASLLPRTVSSLTKSLKSTTQVRRRVSVLVAILALLRLVIPAVLSDSRALACLSLPAAATTVATRGEADIAEEKSAVEKEGSILDDRWLKATTSQIKLALANVVKIRSHEREEVRHALFGLCLAVCEECAASLSDSLPLIVDTMLVLSGREEQSVNQEMDQALLRLSRSNENLADMMRNSLDVGLNCLPRLMRSNDHKPKQQLLRQISAAVRVLDQSRYGITSLDIALATSLVESVVAATETSNHGKIRTLPASGSAELLDNTSTDVTAARTFGPVIYSDAAQAETLTEVNCFISQIQGSSIYQAVTHSIIARACQSRGNEQLSALWLSLGLLQNPSSSLDGVLSQFIQSSSHVSDATPYLISDLYSVSLPVLLNGSISSSRQDWRLTALAIESVVLQAAQLGASYRPEFIDTLYPILSLLGSPEPQLRSHSVTALNLLAAACEYQNSATMLVENADYLVNAIALKLDSFDLSPQGPQTLLMMLRLCGSSLIPYLDDMVGSIFAALDSFHGYSQLVELLFDVLAVLVDEAVKDPEASISKMPAKEHRKCRFQPSTVDDIIADLRACKRRMKDREVETAADPTGHGVPPSAPRRPWTTEVDADGNEPGAYEEATSQRDDEEKEVGGGNEEKEKPLSKTHSLLLSIARATIPHLASPSSRVRLTLIHLLNRISPLLARHEDSFLPLVNDIWPSLLPRVFSAENHEVRYAEHKSQSEERRGGEDDAPYVSAAAADAIATICRGAGDFMSSRIEEIFPRLEQLCQNVWSEIDNRNIQHRQRVSEQRASVSHRGHRPGQLQGAVDLRIINSEDTKTGVVSALEPPNTAISTKAKPSYTQPPPPHHHLSNLHESLIALLSTILTHVRVKPATGDAILALLLPTVSPKMASASAATDFSTGIFFPSSDPTIVSPEDEKANGKARAANDAGRNVAAGAVPDTDDVIEALEIWNEDALWLAKFEQRQQQDMQDMQG